MTTTPPTSEPLPSPHRSPRQRPGSMKDTWLETILESSRADAAAVEEAMKTARPDAAIAGLPSAAKNMFHHVILMLETAQKTKSYKSDLKELCMTVDQCCTTISGLCTNQQPTRTEPRICVDLCKEFAGLLEQLRITVSKLETKVQSPVGRMKAHLHLGKTTSKITEHEKQLNTFSERLQPVADLDRVFMLKTDLVSLSAVVDSNEVPTSARIFGDANFAQNSISNSTVINVPFSGAGNVVSSLNIMVPAQEHSEVLKIFNCPQPIRFFCGRTDILGKMTSYFDSGVTGQKTFLLYGLGGIGKTQIALKFLTDAASKFTEIWFLNASSHTTIQADYKRIAADKNLTSDAKGWLEHRTENWMVLFDNADDPALDLHKYIPSCQHGNVIITSRNRHSQAYTIINGEDTEILQMDVESATGLLLLRAGIKNPSTTQKDEALEIVKDLHCFPLAVVQAGAYSVCPNL